MAEPFTQRRLGAIAGGADDRGARDVELLAEPRHADGGLSRQALAVQLSLTGDAQVRRFEASAQVDRVDDDPDAAPKSRAEECEHPKPQAAGGPGTGRSGGGELARSLGEGL